MPIPELATAVPVEAEVLPDDETEVMPAPQPSVLGLVPLKPKPKDDFDDEEPPRAPDDDEEQDEERPARSRVRRPPSQANSPIGLLIAAGILFVLALACGAYILFALV